MTAPVIGHIGRLPLTKSGELRLAWWYSDGDLRIHARSVTSGQLWDRIREGKRRD